LPVLRSGDLAISRCIDWPVGTPGGLQARSLGIEFFTNQGVDVMTKQRTKTDRRNGRLSRWMAGGAVAATLAITALVSATPAQAVSLPGRCEVNAGVWTCLP
jgi:hypothetical protein